jgi:hypothetical protein
MTKSDKSKHNICIARIKRSTFKPYDYNFTKFYETNYDFYNSYANFPISLSEGELIISSTIIDLENYSILTTRRLITKEKGVLNTSDINEVTDKSYGEFNGNETDIFTFGQVELKDGRQQKYFIEVGKASMIMIGGVRTLIKAK